MNCGAHRHSTTQPRISRSDARGYQPSVVKSTSLRPGPDGWLARPAALFYLWHLIRMIYQFLQFVYKTADMNPITYGVMNLDCQRHKNTSGFLIIFSHCENRLQITIFFLQVQVKSFKYIKKPVNISLQVFKAPRVGLEPTTLRLTAECSAIELSRNTIKLYLQITQLPVITDIPSDHFRRY